MKPFVPEVPFMSEEEKKALVAKWDAFLPSEVPEGIDLEVTRLRVAAMLDRQSVRYEGKKVNPAYYCKRGKVRCSDCRGRGEVKADGCTCGGIDIGVGQMHEPGCGKEQCGRCEGEGEIDWPFGFEEDGSWHVPEIEWKRNAEGENETPLWFCHEGKRYDMDTLKEKR